jgi:hypothetical protein
VARDVLNSETRTCSGHPLLSQDWSHPLSRRVLDPIDRTSEILFGIIMALTFTGSIRVSDAGREDLRAVLVGAIGCNLAWGLVDAVMYLMAEFMASARLRVTLNAIRQTRTPEPAQRLIVDLLPPPLSSALTAADVETLRQRVIQQPLPSMAVTLTRTDLLGAAGVFLLVSLSTFPVVVPLMIVGRPQLALRLSNGVAVLMLFILGTLLGQHAGRPGWRTGFGMVGVGLVLVAITMALGG